MRMAMANAAFCVVNALMFFYGGEDAINAFAAGVCGTGALYCWSDARKG